MKPAITSKYHIKTYFVLFRGLAVERVVVPVKEDEIEAVLKDGVLTISFNKVKQDTVKKIQVL